MRRKYDEGVGGCLSNFHLLSLMLVKATITLDYFNGYALPLMDYIRVSYV